MKYTKITSRFLAISMFMFGVLKFVNPFKASLFGKDAGVVQLQKHFEQSKEKMKSILGLY